MTNKRMAEVLRAAGIYNSWAICKNSVFVHTLNESGRFTHNNGTFVTAPGRKINTPPSGQKLAWYEKFDTRPFYMGSAKSRLDEAFAFAFELTNIPRDQWVLEPFGGRTCWVPKAVLDAKVAWALQNPKPATAAPAAAARPVPQRGRARTQ